MSITVLFILFFVLLLAGLPVSVCLGTSSLVYLLLSDTLPTEMMIQTMVKGLDSFPLIAIPLFIFAGSLMNNSGITDRIFKFAHAVVGHWPGGLGQVNVVNSIIFSGMSGSAVADAGGIGTVEVHALTKNGYPKGFSVGLTAASSLIGPIIPPSIPMVVFGVAASVSIGELFVAGILPGLLMGIGLMIYTYIMAKKHHFPREERTTFVNLLRSVKSAFWALICPLIILGGIMFGIVTPTEAAIIAVVYTLVISFLVYRTLNFKQLIKITMESIETTVTVTFVLATSAIFAWILTYEGIPQMLASKLISVTDNASLILLIIVVVLLILGTFMETGALIVILVPIFMPIIQAVGIDPVHFGIVMLVALMLGMITPPVGLVLFVLNKALKMPLETVVRGTMPFYIPLLIVLVILMYVPQISLLLPNLFYR